MKIGIFGMGAVGSALLNELNGYDDLYILADKARCERYKKDGFIINGVKHNPKCISEGVVDLLIVSLKNYSLINSLSLMEPFVDDNTIILPLLNGITAHEVLANHFINNNVLYGCINVESNKNGNECITSKIYNLQYGEEKNEPIKNYLLDIKNIFDKYEIHNHIYPDMKKRVWLKWMLNLGINQISALSNASYKDMSHPLILDVMHDIFYEVYEVARAYNVDITLDDVKDQDIYCKAFSSDRVTSLTLDVNKNQDNEIDYFGATLIDLAHNKKISVPVNETLYRLLKAYDDNKKKKN